MVRGLLDVDQDPGDVPKAFLHEEVHPCRGISDIDEQWINDGRDEALGFLIRTNQYFASNDITDSGFVSQEMPVFENVVGAIRTALKGQSGSGYSNNQSGADFCA